MRHLRQFAVRLGSAAALIAAIGCGSHPTQDPPKDSGKGTWAALAPYPTPIVFAGATDLNGTLYVVGGLNSVTTYADTIWAYDPAANTWTARAPIPTPRLGLGVTSVNGILYAIGGSPYHPVNKVEAYDPASNHWTTKTPMHCAREEFGVGVVNGTIYVVGGVFGPDCGNAMSVEAYDPVADTWTPKAPIPVAYLIIRAAVVNGIVYAVSGIDTTQPGDTIARFMLHVQAYDPSTDTWTTKSSHAGGGSVGVGVIDGVIYVLGGNSSSANLAYDPVADTWTVMPSMQHGRSGLAAAAVNGKLYAVGGDSLMTSSFAMLNWAEAYSP